MRPTWAAQYLNLPFAEGGRTREGVDCYGLVSLVFAEQRGIRLPTYIERCSTAQDRQEIAALCRGELATNWQEIPVQEATLFDGLIFRIFGQRAHFGLVLDPPYFLHTMRMNWSVIERWDSLVWEKRLVGAVRYAG